MKEAEDREETIRENIFCITAAPLDLQWEEEGLCKALHKCIKQQSLPQKLAEPIHKLHWKYHKSCVKFLMPVK